MRFEKSKQLYNYWLNLKGNRAAPERSEIEPGDIRKLLGDTFILEVNHAAKYVIYRLAGTKLCDAYGKELKGLGYLVHWEEGDTVKVLSAISNVYSNNIPNVISHHGRTEQNRFMDYETLLLPLQPVSDGTTRILGISSPGKTPFWLGAEPIVSHHLRSIRQMGVSGSKQNETIPFRTPPAMHPEIGEPSLSLQEVDTQSDGSRKYAHLTLLDGGKT